MSYFSVGSIENGVSFEMKTSDFVVLFKNSQLKTQADATQQTQPTPQAPKSKEMFDWCKVFRQTNPISANIESLIPEKDEGYDPLVLCETGKELSYESKEREEISMKGRIHHE